MWILFAILHVGQLLAHVKAIFTQRHVRYLLAQGLVLWNLRWNLRRNLRWQRLDAIVGTSLDEPDGTQGNGKQYSQQLQKGRWTSHHLWRKVRTNMVKISRPGDRSLLRERREKKRKGIMVFISRTS